MENNGTPNENKIGNQHSGEDDPERKPNGPIVMTQYDTGHMGTQHLYNKHPGKRHDETKDHMSNQFHPMREIYNKNGSRHYSHVYNKSYQYGNGSYGYPNNIQGNTEHNMQGSHNTLLNGHHHIHNTHNPHNANNHHFHNHTHLHPSHGNYSHAHSSAVSHPTMQNRTNSISYYNKPLLKKASVTNNVGINADLNNPNLNANPNTKYPLYKKNKKSLTTNLATHENNIVAVNKNPQHVNNINSVNFSNFSNGANFSTPSNYTNMTNLNGQTYLNYKSYKNSESTLKKLIFINSYEKCTDFTNYKNFLTVNLKFLKQNFKVKENNLNNNAYNRVPLYDQRSTENVLHLHQDMELSDNDTNKADNNINNPMFSFNPYLNVNMMNMNINLSTCVNKKSATETTYSQNTVQINNQIKNETDKQNVQSKNRKISESYYDNEKLQPYSFVKDDGLIEQNLNTGRYLKGEIRINKCHTHGYITVKGLENDILIRGNRNLNQSLHLDEVVVELFPMSCWKPLFNKKTRKLSLFPDKTATKSGRRYSKDNYNAMNDYYNTDNEADRAEENIDRISETKRHDANSEEESDFKENFNNIEERLAYLNKIYNLRPEGRIVKIASSPKIDEAHIVRIVNEKQLIFACPIDENLPKIFIKMKKFRRVEFVKKLDNDINFRNKYFLVRIVGWALNFKCPKGIIVNELGNSGDIEVETEVLLKTYDIDYGEEYPQKIMEELKQAENFKIDVDILKDRVDLRDDIIFTIDPKTSKDLDDAISVKVIDEESGLLEIGVHIADPSHFVRKDSLLDKEAMNRTTTVYLVHKNIPMLPRSLSENLCSLLPYEDRLAFSCVFRIYLNGALDTNYTPKFFLSVINSSAKWYYELVQKIIDDEDVKYEDLSREDGTQPLSQEKFKMMYEQIKTLHKLTKLVRTQRIESGSLIIERKEVSFELNEETKLPIGYKFKTKSDSNHMIEELMLIANKLTAEYLYDNIKQDALVRKHPFINDNKFQEIHRYLTSNKLVVDFENPQALNAMLLKIKTKDLKRYICIQNKLKNFMQRAEYVICADNDLHDLRHSALNFDLYTHFTSPIRRYPDIIVHRQLKNILLKNNSISPKLVKLDDHIGYDRHIDYFNEKYVNGKLISTKSGKVFHCLMIRNRPPRSYKAYVIDINYKHINKNKRTSNGSAGNYNFSNSNNNQTDTGPSLVINLLIVELGLEIEWKKEDNPNLINFKYNMNDNSLTLDFKTEDGVVLNKTVKTFDEINVIVSCTDTVPLDIKGTIDLP